MMVFFVAGKRWSERLTEINIPLIPAKLFYQNTYEVRSKCIDKTIVLMLNWSYINNKGVNYEPNQINN